MKRIVLIFSLLFFLSSQGFARSVSKEEILLKLQKLEQEVNRLESENRELEAKVFRVSTRKETKKLQIDGMIVFRASQTQNIEENGGKSVYGDPGNGFLIRKARVRFHGILDNKLKYMIHLRADRGSKVELWDAYVGYRFKSFPVTVKGGLFKVPFSLSYSKSGTRLWFPERPVVINKLTPAWKDIGLSVTYFPIKNTRFIFSILNGEGWSSNEVYNRDRKYVYTFVADVIPVNDEMFKWRLRVGYETGYDRCSKFAYVAYGASIVKRNLIDVETELDLKSLGLSFEGGYVHDNPENAKSSDGVPLSLGDAEGFYVQGNYQFPTCRKFHLVGRYSWVDPNDKVNDSNDVDYTSLGFYYLINGWQAVIRSAYVWANERHGNEKANNLCVAELQLLF